MKYLKNVRMLASYINDELMYNEVVDENSSLCLNNIIKTKATILLDILFLEIQPNINFFRLENSTLNRLQSEVSFLMKEYKNFEDIEFVNTRIELVDREVIISTTVETIYSQSIIKVSNYDLDFFPMINKKENLKISY